MSRIMLTVVALGLAVAVGCSDDENKTLSEAGVPDGPETDGGIQDVGVGLIRFGGHLTCEVARWSPNGTEAKEVHQRVQG